MSNDKEVIIQFLMNLGRASSSFPSIPTRSLVGAVLYYTPPFSKHRRNVSLMDNRVAEMKNKSVVIGLRLARTLREGRDEEKEKYLYQSLLTFKFTEVPLAPIPRSAGVYGMMV